MIIGTKRFGIEFKKTSIDRGLVKLWIRGNPLGSFGEDDSLFIVWNNLDKLIDRLIKLPQPYLTKSNDDVFNFLLAGEDENIGKTIVTIECSFDDFVIRAYKSGNNIVFHWKIVDEPYYDYPPDQLNKLFCEEIELRTFKKVLSSFKKEIDNYEL